MLKHWHSFITFSHRHFSYSERNCGSASKGCCFPCTSAAAAKQDVKEEPDYEKHLQVYYGAAENFHGIIQLKLQDANAAFI